VDLFELRVSRCIIRALLYVFFGSLTNLFFPFSFVTFFLLIFFLLVYVSLQYNAPGELDYRSSFLTVKF